MRRFFLPGLFVCFLSQTSCSQIGAVKEAAMDRVVDLVPLTIDTALGEGAWKAMPVEKLNDISLLPLSTPLLDAAKNLYPQFTNWNIEVIVDATPNAFALPGGFIAVNTGLIAVAQDASELQGVLAHEIAHVVKRHGLQRYVSQHAIQWTFGAIGMYFLGDIGMLSGILTSGAAQLSVLKFSRDQERDADQIGLEILKKAGVSGKGMHQFFSNLERVSKSGSNKGAEDLASTVTSWLSTHPMPKERAMELEKLVSQQEGTDTVEFKAAEQAFNDNLEQIRVTVLNKLDDAKKTAHIQKRKEWNEAR
jgi:beta-barrel assembly-enhancing protease